MVIDINERITRDRQAAQPDARTIVDYRRYIKGDQYGLELSDEQQAILTGVLHFQFADNICHPIVATAADRLWLDGFAVADADVSTWLEEFRATAQLDSVAADAHYGVLRDGNGAALLGWNDETQRVSLSYEPWWDGSEGSFVRYTPEGSAEYGVKEWVSTEVDANGITQQVRRRVVYFPDHFERYVSTPAGFAWQALRLPEDVGLPTNEQGFVQWTRRDGTPLGIPLVHFSNVSRAPGEYGDSDLINTPAFQDRLNDTQNSLLAAIRMTGYQRTWMSGVPLKDEDGNDIEFKAVPGAIYHAENPDAKFGTLAAGMVSEIIHAYREMLQSLARTTGMPIHFITGDWPSGEALLRAEMTLIDRVRKRQAHMQGAWQTIAHRATAIYNAYGGGALNEDAMIVAKWKDPERRDPLTEFSAEREFWTAAGQAKSAGVPLAVFLRLHGWEESKIRAIEEAQRTDPFYQAAVNAAKNMSQFAPTGGNMTPGVTSSGQDISKE